MVEAKLQLTNIPNKNMFFSPHFSLLQYSEDSPATFGINIKTWKISYTS